MKQLKPIAVIWGLLAASFGVVSLWTWYEADLLETDRRPITWYARRSINRYSWLWTVILIIFSFLFGVAVCHFYLDSNQEPLGS